MMHKLERPLLVLAVGVSVAAFALPEMEIADVPWALTLYGGESLLAGFATLLDKRAAVKGGRRFSELGLHLLELFGGFPGAYVAQNAFHHKTVKRGYRVVFWAIALLHVAGWVWYLSISRVAP